MFGLILYYTFACASIIKSTFKTNNMKKIIIIATLFCSINSYAQSNIVIDRPITLSNGTTIETSFNSINKNLRVSISNNENGIEVIVIQNGIVVNSETTFFTNDEIQLNLSKQDNGEYEIYVKTGNEIQLVGTVESGIKPEEE